MQRIATAWMLERGGEPLSKTELRLEELGPDEALIEVTACGLCHTDLGFANGSVAPRHALPLVLGHEITGVVKQSGEHAANWVGRSVLVPAVMPCGDCVFCRAGRGNVCPNQKMPGNDIHGGFASHIVVSTRSLVSLSDAPADLALDSLSVVADAVSTAYQAVVRAGLGPGDVAFVVGAGGVGGYVAQIAKARGANVLVMDVKRAALDALEALGIDQPCDVGGREPRDVRKELHARAKQLGVPSLRFRIFECSGTAAGQLLAYTLLAPAATLVFVGFTRDAVNVRLSNLMAFDATAHGTWGCPIDAYPAVLDLVYAKKVVLEPFIERAPMSELNAHLRALGEHRLTRRLVLDPRA